MKKHFTLFVVLMIAGSLVYAAENSSKERQDRSMGVFAKAMDSLLLDTPHVFVQPDEKMDGVYLAEIGAVFTSHISITGFSNVSVLVKNWSDWFNSSTDQPPDPDDIDIPTPPKAEKDSSASKEKTSKEKEITIKRFKNISDQEAERIANMAENLAAFKKEMIATILDYGPVIKGLKDDDEIVIVLFVADREFKEKYGASECIARVRVSDLEQIKNKTPDDAEILQKIKFNF
jgi:hypothetical protein